MNAERVTLAVVGSANLDIVVPVARHPGRGETVLGGDHSQVPGGKGANQAVAAARLGAEVTFVGRIGTDPAGEVLESSLANAGVATKHLGLDASAPSGIAMITVGPDGDNTIVVSPGANSRLTPEHIAAAAGSIRSADALLLQLETPIPTVLFAARSAAGVVVLDPAPAPPQPLLASFMEAVDAVDVIVPNETELAILAGLDQPPDEIEDIIEAARSMEVPQVVVTLGAQGAVAVGGETAAHIPAPPVTPVDTTGAGDAFRAALTIALADGCDLVTSATWAVRVGAAATMRHGAQPSMPTTTEVDELLGVAR